MQEEKWRGRGEREISIMRTPKEREAWYCGGRENNGVHISNLNKVCHPHQGHSKCCVCVCVNQGWNGMGLNSRSGLLWDRTRALHSDGEKICRLT